MSHTSEIAERVRPHRRDSCILVGFLVAATTLYGFLKLASEVVEGDTVAIDVMILQALRTAQDMTVPVGPTWLKTVLIDFTALGGAPILALVTLLAVGFLAAQRKWATAAFVVLSICGGAVLSALIKTVFSRERPELVPHLVEVASPSFPSGHAMNSAIVYLTLAVLLARSQEPRRLQVYLISIAVCLTLLVGTTRVFLGVHWPGDVLAGWMVGAAWAALCSLGAKMLQNSRRIERPAHETPV